ncbi:Ig-like domain-containing protein [Nocardioides sp.]|uniref:Ig-like domain-containing protein n=1 Tax=Nocardioides sp. TaxID=35761 RepID=UPI002604D9EE|nr:Ig-like domain-containing protein [Nocardioides sp.]
MSTTRTRAASALVAAALGLTPLALGGVTGAAHAASRSALTSVDTTYLSDTLGLPSSTIVETVTYDRFQWLLQQPGQYAFLIGDPADAGFKVNAVAVDAAARAAGVRTVYWFDPNLSGYTDQRNLDTRNPAGIGLAASSQTVFGNTWKHLLGAYLGNGIKSTAASTSSVTIGSDDSVVNDAVDPLFDYRSGHSAVAGSSDDLFFVYDKDHTSAGAADKILSWTDLSDAADTAAVTTGVTTVLGAAGGGAAIDALDQFHWWKSAANGKHAASYADTQRYGGDLLTDADAADGWRIKQVTYPELLHLLDAKESAQQNFALLFGGTWCHNTRAVLKDVNAQAQDNDVKVVYNFDLVLDGGTTNGTNGGSNPIHVRDNANSGTTTNFRPSYLYGDLVRTYLKNVVTEYDPNSGSRVAYYPKGDTTAFPDVVRKLQVPFLVNYQRGTGATPASTAVKRQWIQQNSDASTGLATFKEYMSEWWFTHPSARLGLNPTFTSVANPGFPTELTVPASADAAEAAPDSAYLTAAEKTTLSAGDQTSVVGARRALVEQALTNKAFGQEAVSRLKTFFGGLPGGVVSDQVVKAVPATVGTVARVNLSIANDYGRIPTGQVTLKIAGRTLTATVANASAAFAVAGLPVGSHAFTVSYTGDDQIVGFTRTGTLTVAKASVTKVSGKVTKVPTSKKAGALAVTVQTPAALTRATGAVTVTLTKGTKATKVAGVVRAGSATVTVPKLAKGTWKVTVAYAGDATYLKASSATTTLKITK